MIFALEGDMDTRPLLEAHKELVRTVEVGHDGIHLDVDTWEAYLILDQIFQFGFDGRRLSERTE
jgi:CTP:molybdopterin cytidylyltransferase MocA